MKKKYIFVAFFLLIVLCLGAILFSFLRFRGGKVISISNRIDNVIPIDDIVFFRQDDESWAEDKLGSSVYSMKKSGCLVTCIAAAIPWKEK